MDNYKICVIGLGYVGLPLARLFSTKYPTKGFALNQSRVEALMQGHDATHGVSDELLREAIAKYTSVANQLIECMNLKGAWVKDFKILILGITFKEDYQDIRNSKDVEIYHALQGYTGNITALNPWTDAERVKKEYGITTINNLAEWEKYVAVILAVAHKEFAEIDDKNLINNEEGGIYDVKGIFPREIIDARFRA